MSGFERPGGTTRGNAGGPSMLLAFGGLAASRLLACDVEGVRFVGQVGK